MTQHLDLETENIALLELIREIPYLISDFDNKIYDLEVQNHSLQESLVHKDNELDRLTKENVDCNLNLPLLKNELEDERCLNSKLIKNIHTLKLRQIQLESKDVTKQSLNKLMFYSSQIIKKKLIKLFNLD